MPIRVRPAFYNEHDPGASVYLTLTGEATLAGWATPAARDYRSEGATVQFNQTRPRLLDLFSGAGGCAVGYHRAGFDVVGVDHRPQPRYPFPFLIRDALQTLEWLLAGNAIREGRCGHQLVLDDFAAIHASPPCQGYSRLRHLPWLKGKEWPKLIEPCRKLLDATGLPWVIENVEDAPLGGIVLCGLMFGLPVFRHRRFEASFLLLQPSHQKHSEVIGSGRMLNDRRRGSLNAGSRAGSWRQGRIVTVAGGQFHKADGERALGINWMSKAELCQAIPPSYSEFVGRQLLTVLEGRP